MQIGTLSTAAIACAALAGCASTGKYMYPWNPLVTKPEIDCTRGNCTVTVTVNENSDGTCVLDNIGPINLSGDEGIKKITWKIADTENYKFSNESYKFAFFVKVEPEKKIKSANVTSGGKDLVVQFEKRGSGKYTYGLHAQRVRDDSFCQPLDPWLIS